MELLKLTMILEKTNMSQLWWNFTIRWIGQSLKMQLIAPWLVAALGEKIILTPITQSTLEGAFQSGCCFICAHLNPLTKEKSEGTWKESACLPQGSEPCTEWLFLRWAFVKDFWVYSLQGHWRRIVFILTRERQGLYWNNLTPKHLSPIFQPPLFLPADLPVTIIISSSIRKSSTGHVLDSWSPRNLTAGVL